MCDHNMWDSLAENWVKCITTEISGSEVARRCDVLLGRVNLEYKNKRASRRLGPVQFMGIPLSDFVDRIGGSQHQDSWQTQFKFLPLYRRTWEEVNRWG